MIAALARPVVIGTEGAPARPVVIGTEGDPARPVVIGTEGGAAGLTPSGISSLRSGACDPDVGIRYWEADNVRPTLLLVEAGVSLCGGASVGRLVEDGIRRDVERRRPVEVAELASDLPASHRDAFLARARRLFPRGKVAEGIARAWRSKVNPSWWLGVFGGGRREADPALDVFVRDGLLVAIEEDARRLAGKSAETCGKLTFEHRYVDANGVECRRWWRYFCASHRCPHWAKHLGFLEADRIRAQLIRDTEAGRPPSIFLTVTLDPSQYASPVEAMKGLDATFRRFVELLRARSGLLASGGELAYWYSVESHASGWPHVHALIRCEALAEEMIRCGQRVRRARTADERAAWERAQRTEEADARAKAARQANRRLLAEYRELAACIEVPARVRRELRAMAESEATQVVPELPVPPMAEVVDDPAPSWDALCERVRAAQARKRASGRASCPFPALRHALNDLAVEAGFGRAGFYVEPVLDIDKAADYLTKSQVRSSPSKVAEELTKTRQVPGVIPRHFRRFRASGKAGDKRKTSFFLDEQREATFPADTIDLAIIRATPDDVRAHYVERGVGVVGDEYEVDFRGEVPARGERRPCVLGSFVEAVVVPSRCARPPPQFAVVEGAEPHP